MIQDLTLLMRRLGYHFEDNRWLTQALKHRSCGLDNNERLEFLGDSILNFIIAQELFQRFPKAKEGALSRLRAYLVREETLAELALELELGEFIALGPGELKSGGASRPSLLADCLEAIIAAIYFDSHDMQTCYKKVMAWYVDRMDALSLTNVHKDPKSKLQEFLQSKQLPVPQYHIVDITGEDHDRLFTVESQIELLDHPVKCTGRGRRKAEQAVAEQILKEIDYDE